MWRLSYRFDANNPSIRQALQARQCQLSMYKQAVQVKLEAWSLVLSGLEGAVVTPLHCGTADTGKDSYLLLEYHENG